MSKPKYQTTPFARFFLFMIIFLPITYFGVSMVKGKSFDEVMNQITQKISNVFDKKGNKGNLNIDEDTLQMLSKKDEEIQKLREELFICNNSKK